MKRISKIIKKTNFMQEFGYLVVTPKGMIVYNGEIGIMYSRSLAGEKLCTIADKHGPYAFPEPVKFLRSLSVLEDIKSVDLIKNSSAIQIKFSNKGSILIPIVMNLGEDLPHLLLNWQDHAKASKKGFAITSLWNEIYNLTTNEGEALWGNSVGVYGHNKELVSFDHGVYIHSTDGKASDFFCPRSLLELGLRNLDYAVTDISDDTGDSLYLVGKNMQYVCIAAAKSEVVEEMCQLKSDFEGGDKKKVSINATSGLWQRSKVFAETLLTMKIKKGNITVGYNNWEEIIGTTEAPDSIFTTRISILERWASGTVKHGISINENSEWNLHGTTRGGLQFYATLTDYSVFEKMDEEEDEIESMPDLSEGESLL